MYRTVFRLCSRLSEQSRDVRAHRRSALACDAARCADIPDERMRGAWRMIQAVAQGGGEEQQTDRWNWGA